MSVTQTIRQLMTVNQLRLDTRNRGFATDGTAEMPLLPALWGLS